ncbi:Lpp/OprI family alanine-zipper lipoprotein, partial [Vibrio splendidus]
MNKMLIAATASSVLLLAGCSSGPDEETMTKMNALNDQVSQLNQDVQALKDEKATLTSEAQRAKSTAE